MSPFENRIVELETARANLERQAAQQGEAQNRLRHERDEYRKLYELVRKENESLRRGLLGKKAERLPNETQQLSLQILGQMLGDDAAGEGGTGSAQPTQEVKPHTRRKPTGRKPLPEHLPVIRIEHLPNEVKQKGLDAFDRIGEEVSEVLERRPSSLVRVQNVRPKYAPKDRRRQGPTEVVIAPPVELPIERGLAGPGLLADTIVKRWEDHIPLNRMERVFQREGIDLARSTIGGWHGQLAVLAQSLIRAMFEDALTMPYLCTDATGVLVLAKNQCRNGHFWVLVAPERHVLFRYSDRHNGKAVDDLLGDYEGYLVADAHSVYDHLYNTGRVKECGCWSHCRRYFYKALASDPERANIALTLIGELFKIERATAGSPRKKRETVRRERSQPVLDRFFAWCAAQKDQVLDESPIAKGIGYARNQEMALQRFVEDGRLPIHNNISERELRREAVGRKNWLFLGSREGALANTTFVSLLASCRLHRIEPWSYLRDLLCLLPAWPARRVLELAPAFWKETRQQADARQRLDANPMRAVTIMQPEDHRLQS